MSHLYAIRCTVCGLTDDPMCPECGHRGSLHGTTEQRPWRHVLPDGYVHEWHPDCVEQNR